MMKMKNCEKLVSIIIPVYNVERYLEKCLRSIMSQNYKNLEIIVVNDGSPDHSEEVILRLAEKDSRIKYIKKENGGLSSARNAGIEASTGYYICFVDSDDWVDTNFVGSLIDDMESNNSDVAICNMTYVFADDGIKKRTPCIKSSKVVSNAEALKDLFNGKKFKFHAQNKIYKTSLFRDTGIRYPLGKIYEDVFTTYKLIYRANKVSYINKNLFYYLQNRPGSILHTRFNKNRFDIYKALDEIQDFISKEKIDIRAEFQHLVVINVISLANYIYPIYDTLDRQEQDEYRSMLQSAFERYELDGWHRNKSISVVEKVRFYLIKKWFSGYMKLMQIVKRG